MGRPYVNFCWTRREGEKKDLNWQIKKKKKESNQTPPLQLKTAANQSNKELRVILKTRYDNEHSLDCAVTFPFLIRYVQIHPNHYWGGGVPGERRHFSFDLAAPLHRCPWKHSCGGAAPGCPHPPTACSALCWNANTWLSEEKYNLGRNTKGGHRILVTAAGFFSCLVHHQGLSSPGSSEMTAFRNDHWYHRYQQALGKWRANKNYCERLWHGRVCGPKGGFCRANMHEVTRQTAGADNHRSLVQSSHISKLKMGR